ncbi:MAG: Ig-like domain-containing protein [bacterium]|nr:Ig-like domain-containing protein [bacterium]
MIRRFITKCVSIATVLATIVPMLTIAPPAQAATLGGNATFDAVFYYDGNSWSDLTSAASNATVSDVQLGSAGSANGVVYFGMQSPVDKLYLEFGQWGGGTGSLTWQYSLGASICFLESQCWSSATVTSNPSTDFKTPSGNGVTEVQLATPSSFQKRTVNGVTAYWVRAKTNTDYGFTAPKATKISARAYNVKATINRDGGVPITTSMPAWLSGCTVNDGEWNVGDGTHYYALRTDGGSCTIQFLLDGYLDYSTVPTTNLNTILKDLGAYTLSPRIKITLKDDAGNALIDPTIWYDGTNGIEYSVGNVHYIPAPVLVNKELRVIYPGYVTEDGSGGGYNTAFGDVSTDASTQVIIDMTGSSGCTGVITAGIKTCRRMHRDLILTVLGPDNGVLTGASVKMYTDAGYTTLADDLSSGGMNDAQGTSDGDGEVWLAINSGTYYLKVTAGGYSDATMQLPITSGILNTKTVTMSVPGQNPPDTTVSATQSTVAVAPGSVPSDGVTSATFTVTAKNASGTGLSGKTVTTNSSLVGVTISPASVVTDSTGVATFTVKSAVQGSTTLTAVAGGVALGGQASLTFTPVAVPEDTNVSVSQSSIGVSPSSITADGVKTAILTVIAKNATNQALSGKTVTTNSSLVGVTISPASAVTDNMGVATFTVKSTVQGSTTLTAIAGGVTLSGQAVLSLTAPIQAQCQAPIVPVGSLVKLPDDGDLNTQIDSAVYYYGADCKRHAFPNSRVYFSWYSDFANVAIVTPGVLANMQLGSNVTYRPGVKMVKFTTDDKVYAVSKGGTLRWIKTEAVAIALYGSTWNKNIDDVSDAFYTNYKFGSDVNNVSDFNVQSEKNNASSIDDSL